MNARLPQRPSAAPPAVSSPAPREPAAREGAEHGPVRAVMARYPWRTVMAGWMTGCALLALCGVSAEAAWGILLAGLFLIGIGWAVVRAVRNWRHGTSASSKDQKTDSDWRFFIGVFIGVIFGGYQEGPRPSAPRPNEPAGGGQISSVSSPQTSAVSADLVQPVPASVLEARRNRRATQTQQYWMGTVPSLHRYRFGSLESDEPAISYLTQQSFEHDAALHQAQQMPTTMSRMTSLRWCSVIWRLISVCWNGLRPFKNRLGTNRSSTSTCWLASLCRCLKS